MTNIQKLVKNYYRPHDVQGIEDIDNEIITEENESKRELLLKKYSPFIEKLKIRFKELVLARNKLAQKRGFDNYFDFISGWDKVPKKKLNDFLENGDVTAKKIVESLPKRFKNPAWLKGNYNNFNFSGMVKDKKFDIPDDVFEFLKLKLKVKKEVLAKIELKKTDKFIYSINNDFDKKKVWIEYDIAANGLHAATGFAHECGHAIEYLKLIEKGIKPESKPYYYHETHAIDVEMKFVNSLPSDMRKAHIGNFLYTFANAFFENEIYKNPNCDYEVAYAESRNKVYPQIKQKRNPFYVFNTFLIEYPCYSTIYSVIYNEKLKAPPPSI